MFSWLSRPARSKTSRQVPNTSARLEALEERWVPSIDMWWGQVTLTGTRAVELESGSRALSE